MSLIGYILVFGLLAAFGASTVLALAWAMRTGQLSNPGHSAESIFDADEPVGRMTDSFPGEQQR